MMTGADIVAIIQSRCQTVEVLSQDGLELIEAGGVGGNSVVGRFKRGQVPEEDGHEVRLGGGDGGTERQKAEAVFFRKPEDIKPSERSGPFGVTLLKLSDR